MKCSHAEGNLSLGMEFDVSKAHIVPSFHFLTRVCTLRRERALSLLFF